MKHLRAEIKFITGKTIIDIEGKQTTRIIGILCTLEMICLMVMSMMQ